MLFFVHEWLAQRKKTLQIIYEFLLDSQYICLEEFLGS